MTGLLTSAGVGMPAPDFELADAAGRRITLADLRGQPAILAFYPPGWDPARAEQLAHFNALVARVPGVNAELLGITTDGVWCNLAFSDDDIRVPLLADIDPHGDVAESYGVRGEQAVFVLDADGVIRWRQVGTINTDELVAALTALAPEPEVESVAPPATTDATAGQLAPNRREFITTALAAALILAAKPIVAKAEPLVEKLAPPLPKRDAVNITLSVNGRDIPLTIEPRVTLLDALREYAGLTGTKKGCDHGQCGACTVHVNGRRQLSCLTFAAMHQGAKITTVEGLANGDDLHPMQTAFIKHDGFQCGYCTPGQLMSATALLKEPCGSGDADVKECMSGNICRCGAYPGIVAAIQEVRSTARG